MKIIREELAQRLPYEPGFRLDPQEKDSEVIPVFELAAIKRRGEKQLSSYFVAGIHEKDASLSLICARENNLEEVEGIWVFREPRFIAEEDITEYLKMGRGFDTAKIAEVSRKHMQGYLQLKEEPIPVA